MERLLLGITLVLWSLNLLNIISISSVILGLFALVTGILYIAVSLGVVVPAIPSRRRAA